MAVKIKLKRMGKIRAPYYRIVIADSRTKRDGRAIEEIGKYHPKEEPSLIEVDSERVQYWLSVGAQPTEAVAALLRVTGDWQRFKGLPGAEGTLRVAGPRPDKKAAFDEAAREAMGAGAGRASESTAGGAPASRARKTETRPSEPPATGAVAPREAATGEAPTHEAATHEAATGEAATAETATETGEVPSTPEPDRGSGPRTDGSEA